MSIAEQAQQLHALADDVPVGQAEAIREQLGSMQQQVAGILGETSSAQELHGQISAVSNEVRAVSAGLEHLRQLVIDKAAYHQQG
ncbi:hypothetical protein [Saccharopolyspora spinosa]|uniref:Uncharacterized protein n=1 Tax=Saccharopolyspora spinosa TaxID=60894 RepID=A0A2N3XZB1_SACSN|nr:hypothetical protein [Saccharopolyspora spinosa]PKW16013.1 hypothetical protein A8926_3801 [Saccharopolyspora spinosa]